MNSDRKKRHSSRLLASRDPNAVLKARLLVLLQNRRTALLKLNRAAEAFDNAEEVVESMDLTRTNFPEFIKVFGNTNRRVSERIVEVEEIDRDIANLLNEWDALHRWEDNDASGK